jgi:hypothetical protein
MNSHQDTAEPVPFATQLAVFPFLAAVEGSMRKSGDVSGLRITIHRVMSREGVGYLQQICGYITEDGVDWGKAGRTFPVNEGIMGAAYETGHIWRTRRFPDSGVLTPLMQADMNRTGDRHDPKKVGISYLAIPFLGPEREAILILYAECMQLNFFADDELIRNVVAMCKGFCKLFDWFQQAQPFHSLRNFPKPKGKPVRGTRTLYASIQEKIDIEPPRFSTLPSFNYEAVAA